MNLLRIYMFDEMFENILKEFNSIEEAAKYIKGSLRRIMPCIKGIKARAYGFGWVDAELWDNDENYRTIIKTLLQSTQVNAVPTRVINLENIMDNKVMDSISSACIYLGLHTNKTKVQYKGYHIVDTKIMIDNRLYERHALELEELLAKAKDLKRSVLQSGLDGIFGNPYGIIYQAKNKINNKVRIGQTTGPLDERKYYIIRNESRKPDSEFGKDLRTYGHEVFDWDTIDYAHNKDELNNKEAYWVDKRGATNPEIGYNNKDGGINGKHLSRIREKLSEVLTEKNGIRVYGFTFDNGVVSIHYKFKSIVKAAQSFGVSKVSIGSSLGGKYKIKENYWVEADRWDNNFEYRAKVISEILRKMQPANGVQIYKLESGTFELISKFPSQKEAAAAAGFKTSGSIRARAKGDIEQSNGFIWVYGILWENDQEYRDFIINRNS